MKRRKGRFSIPRKDLLECRQAVKTIMQHMIIVQAQPDFMRDSVEYAAFSDLFDEIDDGQVMPQYRLEVDEHLDVYAMRVCDSLVQLF